MQLRICLRDERAVESGGGEQVDRGVESLFVEDLARLLSDSFAEMVVVNCNTRDISCISWNDS